MAYPILELAFQISKQATESIDRSTPTKAIIYLIPIKWN